MVDDLSYTVLVFLENLFVLVVETCMETVDEAHLLLVLTIVRLKENSTQGRREREGVEG